MISIIIPIYNAEKTIGRCLNSILCQKVEQEKYELILIDDGSTDHTSEVCKKYVDMYKNIFYFYQQNKGAAVARNQGIQKSKGEWITFVDADDILECNFFSLVLEKIKTKSDLYIFNINSRGRVDNFNNVIITSFEDKVKLIESICGIKDKLEITMPRTPGPVAKIYMRDLITCFNITFDERIVFAEDMLFNIQVVLEAVQIECINEVIYQYMNNPMSLTNTYHKTDLSHPEYFLMELKKISEKYPKLQRAYEYSFEYSFYALFSRDFGNSSNGKTNSGAKRDFNKLLKNVYPYSVENYKRIYQTRKKLLDIRTRIIIGLLMHHEFSLAWLCYRSYRLLKSKCAKLKI